MNHGNLEELCESYFAIEAEYYFLQFLGSTRAFITSLAAAFKIYRETYDPLWRNRGIECMKEIKLWADQGSSWNFQHKLQMMEAEDHYCNGDIEQAADAYNKAIVFARAHKYINDEALACELAGKFFFDMNNLALSFEYLRLAHEKYFQWKADGKANQLLGFISAKFAGNQRLYF